MFIRLPWLVSRRRLLVAVLLDSLLFAALYAMAFLWRFGAWPRFSLPLTGLLGFWLVCSYVVGRYYDAAEWLSAATIKQAIRTLISVVLNVGLFLGWLWLTASPSQAATSRGFMLPTLMLYALSSGLVQQALNRSLQKSHGASQLWLVLGSLRFHQQLDQVLLWSRLPVRLQRVELPFAAGQDLLKAGLDGLVLERVSGLSEPEIQSLLHLQSHGLPVLTPVGWSELVLQRFPPEMVFMEDLLRGQFMAPPGSIHKRLKRIGDVLVSGLLLLTTAPLLLLAALLIRLDDGGPVFYGQQRSGLDGQPFQVWKLRSMRMDAEARGAQWSGRGDPRITRIGQLLRLTHIDELPQLWAVLTGTMSLIGPRPERPEIETELEHQIPHYRLRHLIRPGLSGWAQVNYPYGASIEDSANKLSFDLYYLRNASFWLDVLILFKTMRLVFNARGAMAES